MAEIFVSVGWRRQVYLRKVVVVMGGGREWGVFERGD